LIGSSVRNSSFRCIIMFPSQWCSVIERCLIEQSMRKNRSSTSPSLSYLKMRLNVDPLGSMLE
jgi:hypothetical protein